MNIDRNRIKEADFTIWLCDVFDGKPIEEGLRNFNNICNDHYIKMKEKWPYGLDDYLVEWMAGIL